MKPVGADTLVDTTVFRVVVNAETVTKEAIKKKSTERNVIIMVGLKFFWVNDIVRAEPGTTRTGHEEVCNGSALVWYHTMPISIDCVCTADCDPDIE